MLYFREELKELEALLQNAKSSEVYVLGLKREAVKKIPENSVGIGCTLCIVVDGKCADPNKIAEKLMTDYNIPVCIRRYNGEKSADVFVSMLEGILKAHKFGNLEFN